MIRLFLFLNLLVSSALLAKDFTEKDRAQAEFVKDLITWAYKLSDLQGEGYRSDIYKKISPEDQEKLKDFFELNRSVLYSFGRSKETCVMDKITIISKKDDFFIRNNFSIKKKKNKIVFLKFLLKIVGGVSLPNGKGEIVSLLDELNKYDREIVQSHVKRKIEHIRKKSH